MKLLDWRSISKRHAIVASAPNNHITPRNPLPNQAPTWAAPPVKGVEVGDGGEAEAWELEFEFEVEFIEFGGSTPKDKGRVEEAGWAEEAMVELEVRVDTGVVEADELGEVAPPEVYLTRLLRPSHVNAKELNATSAKHVPAGIAGNCLLPMPFLCTSPPEGGFSSVGGLVQFEES